MSIHNKKYAVIISDYFSLHEKTSKFDKLLAGMVAKVHS